MCDEQEHTPKRGTYLCVFDNERVREGDGEPLQSID